MEMTLIIFLVPMRSSLNNLLLHHLDAYTSTISQTKNRIHPAANPERWPIKLIPGRNE